MSRVLAHRRTLLLRTRGRRTGRPRTVVLQYFPDGDDMLVVAANAGLPRNPEADAVQALYSMSYAAKFAIRKASGQNVKVSPLEGLWWADYLSTFLTGHKSDWDWTMMIRQPDLVTDDLVERLAAEVDAKKSLHAIHDLRLVTFEEGLAAQVLHVGPYAAEAPTIERLHAYIRDQGFVFDGRRHKHHEIYLGDPRRAAPEKLRTIIRQPYSPS